MHSIVQRQTQQHTYELESDWHFVGVAVKPVEPTCIFGDEHVEVRVEYLFGNECKILIFDSSLVCTFLANKLYFKRTSQIGFDLT